MFGMLGVIILVTPAAAQVATIRVFADQEIGLANRRVLGNNMLAYQGPAREEYSNRGSGIWDPEAHRPVPEYVQLARDCGISVSRWPGGCEAHEYNWKLTVGPLSERPDMQFGLPEFLAHCEAIGAEPILTIAVYWGGPQDGADLVEYLNAPNDGLNPNGGTAWAAVRAADGHPEPYDVVWFEYGNESYHGTHTEPKRQVTAEQYAQQYLAYREAMQSVDARIQLGALIQNGLPAWNRTVLELAGDAIDFAIEHTYVPFYYSNDDTVSGDDIARACLSCDTQIQDIYDQLNSLIEELTGRTDIALAITEYNGHFVQEQPVPYRQCLANALRNADHLRVMMRPQNRILLANFWQFANEYWGMVQGYVHQGQEPVRQANYYVYQLYHQHFGDTLIDCETDCDTFDFDGGLGVQPRSGKPTEYELFPENLLPHQVTWELRDIAEVATSQQDGVVQAEFSGTDVNFYHPRFTLPAEGGMGYRVTAVVKTEALTSTNGAGFQVGDARGWVATQSCSLIADIRGTADWTPVQIEYVTLQDTTEIEILCRRLEGGGPVSGKAWYRLESVQRFRPANAGAVPYLSVNAAKRSATGAVTLMIINKHLTEPIRATITVEGTQPTGARAWSLGGPSPVATNVGEEHAVRVVPTEVAVNADTVSISLPKHSLTAVEIERG